MAGPRFATTGGKDDGNQLEEMGPSRKKANVRGARNNKMPKKHFSYEGNGSGGSDVPFICLISRRGCSRCLPVGGYVNNKKKKDLNHRITACHVVF